MNAITPITPALAALTASANRFAVAAHGEGTRRAYASGFRHYRQWCEAHGLPPLAGDPETIALYATAAAELGHAMPTINGRMAAIAKAHRLANVSLDTDAPILKDVLDGIERTIGWEPRRQVRPVTTEMLRQMLAACTSSRPSVVARDRALLLIGFGAALRRSELCALNIRDVDVMARRGELNAMTVVVRRSKTDQGGRGHRKVVMANRADPEFCPATAFQRWVAHRREAPDGGKPDRPLFCAIDKGGNQSCRHMHENGVVLVIKRVARAAGFDADEFAGHSLRAGFATSADEGGASLKAIMDHMGHANPQTTARYVRYSGLAHNPSAAAFGDCAN